MTILFITTYAPGEGELGGGGGIDSRILSALREAGASVEIFEVCDGQPDSVPLQLSDVQRARVLSRMIVSGEPYQASKFRAFSREWSKRVLRLRSAARGKVVVASQWPSLLLATSARVDVDSYIAHNREYQISVEHSPTPLRILRDAQRLKKLEIDSMKDVDRVTALSALDAQELQEQTKREVMTLPIPLSRKLTLPKSTRTAPTIGFIGKESWPPNREALEALVSEVVPRAAQRGPINLRIAGRGTERWQGAPHVTASGPVADVGDFWREVDVLVLPRFGNPTGVSVKALEASEWLVPSVVTPSVASAIPGAPWRQASDMSAMDDEIWAAIQSDATDAEALSMWLDTRAPQQVAAAVHGQLTGVTPTHTPGAL